MKKLFRLSPLILIIIRFAALQSKAQQTSLAMGIDRRTGQLIGTDIVCKHQYDAMANDSGRMIDGSGPWHNALVYSLRAAFELETNGQSLEGWMIISAYRRASDKSTPVDWIQKLWVDVTDKYAL